MITLSILIPTYNRADKVLRLLKNIEAVVEQSKLPDKINVIVSNNASKDNTKDVLNSFITDKYNYKYFNQEVNLGFDGNIRFLYDKVQTEYMWFFGDDDLIFPDSLNIVIDGIKQYKPDVIVSSFAQPPGSKIRIFNFPELYHLVTDKKKMVELVFANTKISVFVMKNTILSNEQKDELKPFYENGFYFVNLSYTLLDKNDSKLCVISEQLAECDEDYIKFDYKPGTFANMYKIFTHIFVVKYYPQYSALQKDKSFIHEVKMLFGIKMGNILVEEMAIYDKGIQDIQFNFFTLLKYPKVLILMLIMKLGLTKMYKSIRMVLKGR